MSLPSLHPDLPDEALIQAMAQGREDALQELHRRYARLLYSLGHRMLRQTDDVESCVQDAFMNAWRHAGRFDARRAAAKTWLVSIAHHRFLQELRDRPDTSLEIEDWDAPTAAADPTDRIMAERAVQGLEGTHRELVELAYYRGYSHSELAVITGLPVGTVKSRLRAALDRMRVHLSTGGPA
ncbi:MULTISPECIES: RNA polymerase sigma factor [unclassified Deinococcus]|uniref:RNA polymerase sigma factor n=1 Tax=unclassified Deinococcus TaxID=2623546 RepID=UPI001E2B6B5A|nr:MULTISPECIES: sigma-70 family RNA polymerase sigma factor [unclassified Deinococcus]MCD0167055.1 sigma-70 family RNA polymerase sigma factor [Deinococcus sp. 12RED42]MCD0168304.1 sigma-70 family RNA polymerase sigma factor [Deinococcus sp. 23YEL01]